MYALMAAMALLASHALARRRWAAYAVLAALTMYAHNLGALYLASLNLAVLLKERKEGIVRPLILANLGAGLLFAPWLVMILPGQIGFVERGYWVPRPGATELVRTFIALAFNLPLPAWALGPALGGAMLLLALTVHQVWRQRSPAGWLLLLAWGPVLLSFALSQWRPVYIERSFLPGALVYCGAVGWLLTRGGLPRPIRWGLLPLLITLAGVGLVYHYTYRQFPNSDFVGLQADLRRRLQEGDWIVHDNKLSFFPAFYYDRNLPQAFLPDPPGPTDTLALPTQDALDLHPTPPEATLAARRIWFVAFDRAREEAQALGLSDIPNWTWYAERCTLAGEHHVGDLGVYVFERCREGP